MKDRLAFEKWLSDKGMAANYAGDGEYDSPRAQLAWEAWFEVSEQARALLAARDAELEAIGAGGVSATPITKPSNLELIADAAEVIDTLTSKLPDDHPLCVAARERAKRVVEELYQLAEAQGEPA